MRFAQLGQGGHNASKTTRFPIDLRPTEFHFGMLRQAKPGFACKNIPKRYSSMWNLAPDAEYTQRYKWFEKKRKRELTAVHGNLSRFQEALNTGAPLRQVNAGYIHREPHGIIAIDQKGGGNSLRQARLYVF